MATAIARSARVAAGVPAVELQQRRARAERMLRMPPEQAGETIVRAIEERRERVLVGRDAKLISLLERIAPVRYWRVLERLLPP